MKYDFKSTHFRPGKIAWYEIRPDDVPESQCYRRLNFRDVMACVREHRSRTGVNVTAISGRFRGLRTGSAFAYFPKKSVKMRKGAK